MVRGIEDLRTPLSTIIDLDKRLRGTLSGFMMPAFVIDLPGGGGKRLVSTYDSYDEGVAVYTAPGLPEQKGKAMYTYYDPKPVSETAVEVLRKEQERALERDMSFEESNNSPLVTPQCSSMPLLDASRPNTPFAIKTNSPRARPVRGAQTVSKSEDLVTPHFALTSTQPLSHAAVP